MKKTLRDNLAIDRTKLANQRTLLAYLRTSLMMLASGLTLIKLTPDNNVLYFIGIFSLTIATVCFVVGVVNYRRTQKNVKKEYQNVK